MKPVIVLCLTGLLVGASFSRQFSQETRHNDVQYLERLSLRFRKTIRSTHSLVDFLASRPGLVFLAAHVETLWYQELLEHQYGRRSLCQNVKSAETTYGYLTPTERRLKHCLCSEYMPFLHCLALGAQMLRDDGFLNAEMTDFVLPEEPLPDSTTPHPFFAAETANQEEDIQEECLPDLHQAKEDLYYKGTCTVPVAHLFTIKVEEKIAVGAPALEFLDIPQCEVCQGTDGAHCMPVCKDNILLTEALVDNFTGWMKSTVCLDLKQVGRAFQTIFGTDSCISDISSQIYFYQRVLKLSSHTGLSNWRLTSELDYKFADGPECICDLSTFRCTESCSMKKGALAGRMGVTYDFFFGGGSYIRNFNVSKQCYTDHIHEPQDCPSRAAQ